LRRERQEQEDEEEWDRSGTHGLKVVARCEGTEGSTAES
jgi:hypothetical protein